ncbi:MAG: ABC transporter substrate-binding protein [Anaerolineae bacterium]|nr:ABC transporter substrate-binding protein [Anaerolineae bacterium]
MNSYRSRISLFTLLVFVFALLCIPVAAQEAGFSSVDSFRVWNLDEYEAETGSTIATFNEAPMLAERVASGDLPKLEDRLPVREDIQVVQPREAIGTYGGELRYNATNPSTFGNIGWSAWDQHLAGLSTNWEVIFPNIAKSIEFSEDNTVVTITLRRGMKWSDGQPVTSDDIMFWYENIMLHPELPNLPSSYIVGGQPAVLAKVDENTVTVTFATAYPGFIEIIARTDTGFPIAPRHYLEQWHIDFNEDAQAKAEEEGYATWIEAFEAHRGGQIADFQIDPGLPVLKPWILLSIDEFGNKIYERNPYYWKVDTEGNQLPYIDRQIRVLLSDLEVVKLNIQAGDLDYADKLLISDLPVLRAGEAEGNYTALLFPTDQGATRKYQFNITVGDPVLREIFNDIRFRQAMSLAINREEINETLFFGLGIPRQWGVSTNSPFYEDWMSDYYAAYDPEQANALLDEMGLTMGSDGIRLRPDGQPLRIVLWDAIDNIRMDELVVEYWGDIGVATEINPSTREAQVAALLANEVHVSVWFADVVAAIDMHTRPIWFRPPYGLDTTPLGGGFAWRTWWLTNGAEGEEPPPYYLEQMQLADDFLLTSVGSEEYFELGQQLVNRTVEQMMHIGTVGEVPYIYVRSNRIQNFPSESTIYIDHLRGAHSDQWYVTE